MPWLRPRPWAKNLFVAATPLLLGALRLFQALHTTGREVMARLGSERSSAEAEASRRA